MDQTKHYETIGQYYEKGVMVELAAIKVMENHESQGVIHFSNGHVKFQYLDQTRKNVLLTPTLHGVSYFPSTFVYNDNEF